MSSKHKIILFVASGVGLFLLFIGVSRAATLNVNISQNSFAIGDQFSADVKIDSQNTGINAAQATIEFPADILSVKSVDKTGSVFNFWLQDPTFDNGTGKITFIGGSTSGFNGKSLEIFKINFTVKGAGQAGVNFTDGAVTASDGSGTNVLSSMTGVQITVTTSKSSQVITPPPTQISRPAVPTGKVPVKPDMTVALYPDPSAWYNVSSNFIVSWNLPNDVTNVATGLDKNPSFDPTKSEGLFNNKTFSGLSDGIWYLHVRFKNDVGWGPTNNYRIGIDTVPPLTFDVSVKGGLDTATLNPTLEYHTQDQPSGIAFYNITVDNELVTSTSETTFTLPVVRPGNHTIIVEANDLAGNKTSTKLSIHIQELPFFILGSLVITQFEFFVALLVILLLGMVAGWYLTKIKKEQRERRTIIAERDINVGFGTIIREIEFLKKRVKTGELNPTSITELKFSLDKISENAEKMKKYLGSNIEEINE